MATRAAMASLARVALAETPAARIVPRRGMASGGGTFLLSLPFLFLFVPHLESHLNCTDLSLLGSQFHVLKMGCRLLGTI
jgi:hypothetical protein